MAVNRTVYVAAIPTLGHLEGAPQPLRFHLEGDIPGSSLCGHPFDGQAAVISEWADPFIQMWSCDRCREDGG
jgi:hypothetical protein